MSGGDQIALVRLPDPSLAPGYRESLTARSGFTVTELGEGIVTVAPLEGAGAAAGYFEAHKICDSDSDLTDPATWEPLRRRPPRRRDDVDPEKYREDMIRRGQEITKRRPSFESEAVAFALAAFGAAQTGDIDELLKANLPALFERFPRGELWYVTVEDVLLARLAFARAQLAFALTPDRPIGPEMEQLDAFSALSLTKGIDLTEALKPALLAVSPAVLGLPVPAMPHGLVFCFGEGIDLRRPYPTSFSSLYRPRVLLDAEEVDRSKLFAGNEPGDGPALLRWWVERLNVIYSHAADPTRFTDTDGYHDPSAQAAWMITVERLMGDGITLLAEPQGTDLDRVQMAFDLLDKAESLLDYGRDRSGRGFTALLRRRQSLRRLREAFSNLPDGLGERLVEEAGRLFDGLYDGVRENTAGYRLRPEGAMIAQGKADNLVRIDDETLVANLCRAVRNSSHGLVATLREREERFLLAANTGGIPPELPALAPLIALGLLADAEGLIDGSWQTKLVGSDPR